jgi:hypothetical protein
MAYIMHELDEAAYKIKWVTERVSPRGGSAPSRPAPAPSRLERAPRQRAARP